MRLSTRIHWYNFTATSSLFREFRSTVSEKLSAGWINQSGIWSGPSNIAAADLGNGTANITISGEGCDALGDAVLDWIQHGPPHRARRLDLARDGVSDWEHPDRPLCPKAFYNAIYDEAAAHARPGVLSHCLKSDRSCTLMANGQGRTCYIGAPSSERRLRIYDQRKFCRVEVQLRSDKAAYIAEGLRDGLSLHSAFNGVVSGAIHFKPQILPELYTWWAGFLDYAPATCWPEKTAETELAKVVRSMIRQYGSTIRVAMEKAVIESGGNFGDVATEFIAMLMEVKLSRNGEKMRATAGNGLSVGELVGIGQDFK